MRTPGIVLRSWQRRVATAAFVAAMVATLGTTARVRAQTPTVWFRIFLTDGQVIAAHGEFTRVDDHVVVQVPVAFAADGAPTTRPVTISAAAVDWAKTDTYREAVRRAQFEATGGARAYAAFSEEVAATLRDVALIPDPLERIRRLESARARLADWPAAHHGYRADDVASTLSVVDDLLNGMRAAAGQQAFTLAITSTTAEARAGAPPTPLLPPPSLREVIQQALGLASRVTDPAERIELLRVAAARLDDVDGVKEDWVRQARSTVRRQIRHEQRVSAAYERLRDWTIERTARLLAMADVRGLMKLRGEVRTRDAKLRGQRPAELAALLATLDVRLDAARRHRLLLERWAERRPALEQYAAVMQRHVGGGLSLTRALEEVKALSGPDAALLTRAEGQLAGSRVEAGLVVVPDEARTLQQVWLSTQELAARALRVRRAAMRSGDMQQAWEASAAAAGALLLLQQLRDDLAALVRPPAPATVGL